MYDILIYVLKAWTQKQDSSIYVNIDGSSWKELWKRKIFKGFQRRIDVQRLKLYARLLIFSKIYFIYEITDKSNDNDVVYDGNHSYIATYNRISWRES